MHTAPLSPRRFGAFEVLGPIGAGAMGEIYRARDTRLGREVALKVLPRAAATDREHIVRFEREARSASVLSHPNIVTVFDFGWQDEVPYIVTELLDGEDLGARLRRGALPLAQALDVAVQVADGLAAAHAGGILHRDLKPDNLFLTRDGRVKILDFGLARGGDESVTEPGRVLGTMAYMSPEQARAAPLDERSDVFALGAILYEMITGRRAFPGSGAAAMQAILRRQPISLERVEPNVPAGVAEIVRRALEKDPEDRYASARDLAADLRRARKRIGRLPDAVAGWRVARALRHVAWPVAALGLALLVLAMASRTEPARVNVRQVRALAPFLGNIDAPIVFDGRRVLYTVDRAGGAVVYQVGIDGGEPVPLPLPFANARIFDVTRDGAELLVGSGTDPGVMGEVPLWIVPSVGGTPRRVADLSCRGAAFSPDNGTIACAREDELWLVHRDGAQPRLAYKGPLGSRVFSPRWSPDGREIRFTYRGPNWKNALFVYDAATGATRQLYDDLSDGEQGGAWIAGGRVFVYTRKIGTLFGLVARDEQHRAAAPVTLTSGPLDMYAPEATTSDGPIVALGEELRGQLSVWRGDHFEPYLEGPSAHSIAWAPDREHVAWSVFPDGSLWIARADGSERRMLSTPGLRTFQLAWMPDGKGLVFNGSDTHYENRLYTISLDGGLPRRLTDSDEYSERDPLLLSDGTILFTQVTRGAKGPKTARLAQWDPRHPGIRAFPGGDDKCLPIELAGGVIGALGGTERPMLYDAATKTWRLVADRELAWWRPAPDGRSLVVDTRVGGRRGFYRLSLDGRDMTLIADITGEMRTGSYEDRWFSLTPSGDPLIIRTVAGTRVYRLDWSLE